MPAERDRITTQLKAAEAEVASAESDPAAMETTAQRELAADVAALGARLHTELEADFRRRFNRNLEIFFDREDIKDFDHWQVRCHRALRRGAPCCE